MPALKDLGKNITINRNTRDAYLFSLVAPLSKG
jgi:hypothetical protein